MLFADVLAIALSIAGFLLSLQGLWLLCRALWPARVAEAAGRCEHERVMCFLAGAGVTAGFFVVSAVAGKLGTAGQLVAFALGLVYLVYAGVGMAGFVTHIGQRLASPADADRPWKATIRGGVALELACLIPVVGWFGLLPVSFVIGSGATTLSLLRRRRPSPQVLPGAYASYAAPTANPTPTVQGPPAMPGPPPMDSARAPGVKTPAMEPAGVSR